MTTTTEPAEFISARLDEDERAARSASDRSPDWTRSWAAEGTHIARHDPARVLREVEAMRRTVELHSGAHDCPQFITGVYPDAWPEGASWGKAGERWEHVMNEHFEVGDPCPTMRLLAAIWPTVQPTT